MEIIVENNQSIWDLAIQYYGSPSGVRELIQNNPQLNFHDSVKAGSKIQIIGEPLDKAVYEYLKKEELIPATAVQEDLSPSTGGDFNKDFNKDFY